MCAVISAKASPEKRLFISLLTRDISITSAFLDLIDNSINAAIEPLASRLESADAYVALLDDQEIQPIADIRIDILPDKIAIVDTAPGIALTAARDHAFRFGRSQDEESVSDRLSVYGLGLKRAFFKLGRRIKIVSDHSLGGFELDLDVDEWARDTELPWKFDLSARPPTQPIDCGTTIEMSNLHPAIGKRLEDGVFLDDLRHAIGNTYAYFLAKFVRTFVNDVAIAPTQLRVGTNRATDRFEENEVTCTITAGLGTSEGGHYRDKGSGWFVFCNGRSLISADKTTLTGWNNNGLPIFQPKHRPFLGTVYFVSKYADRLPWDTTKSRINEDSEVWQIARRRMVSVGRPVTTFLESRYSDAGSDTADKDLRNVANERLDAIRASVGPKQLFSAPTRRTRKTTTRIQYDAQKTHVKMIADYLDRSGMSGSDVGRYTFDFFFRNEVEEE